MKLSFLGQSYNADPTEIETPETKSTARFRGNAYHPHRPMLVNRKPQTEVRRFRGVEY